MDTTTLFQVLEIHVSVIVVTDVLYCGFPSRLAICSHSHVGSCPHEKWSCLPVAHMCREETKQ